MSASRYCSRCGTPTVPARGFRPVPTGAANSSASPIFYGLAILVGVFGLGPWLQGIFGARVQLINLFGTLLLLGVVYLGHQLYRSMLNARAMKDAEQRLSAIEPTLRLHPEARICPSCFQLEIES